MEDVRSLCTQYKPYDILNIDETGLFWKASPDRTLTTYSRPGRKKAKDRITLALTYNADGSEKYEIWVISKSKNPRCFKNLNRYQLRVQY